MKGWISLLISCCGTMPLPSDALAKPGRIRYDYKGPMAFVIDFVKQEQLLDRALWRRFVRQYQEPDADFDGGWRGEYWGKMMMGACFLCENTQDDALYAVLEETVRDIMAAQDGQGRIASYAKSHELTGWDLWCRKYVMLGMEYFLELCRDGKLARQITKCLCGQMDAILTKVGPEKASVCSASNQYRGLNSSSILEPVVRLYSLTKKPAYLNFARHIVECGGTSVCDVFALALENNLLPYQYPFTKAYEMISCFEGLLELYRVTGDINCKTAALNFTDRLLESDFTVIGSCGCTHEFLDHSTNRQANKSAGPLMQETCVTVSMMKMLGQAARLTGDAKYVDAFELSFYNAYLGALNTRRVEQPALLKQHPQMILEPLPFDSYSPLTAGYRGRGVGGFKILSDHHFYGCCASIGPAGCGLMPTLQLLAAPDALVLNLYEAANIHMLTPKSAPLAMTVDTQYPSQNTVDITLHLRQPEKFRLSLRNPAWSVHTTVSVNGVPHAVKPGYIHLDCLWRDGDHIELTLDLQVRCVSPVAYGHDILMTQMVWEHDYTVPLYDAEDADAKDHIAIQRGPLTFAAQQRQGWDPVLPVHLERHPGGALAMDILPSTTSCLAVLRLFCTDGEPLLLTDYASAGKHWGEDDRFAAWILTAAQ